jgi:hypothetical protein
VHEIWQRRGRQRPGEREDGNHNECRTVHSAKR